MAEDAAGRIGRHVADEFDDVRIVGRRLGEGAFHAVDDGRERDVAAERVAALVVEFADGGADLIVGVGGDVLHQEVDEARVALQDAEDLQRAVGRGRPAGEERL